MAINPATLYPGKITAPSAAYPYGRAQNVTSPGDGTGTPWEQALVNDIFGFQQKLLNAASIVPSGTADNAQLSQYFQALETLFLKRDGSLPMTGELDLGGFKGINALPGVAATDLATVGQLESAGGGGGFLLYEADLSANVVNGTLDITWQAEWDQYEYVDVIVENAVISSATAGNIAFLLSGDAGATWRQFVGSAREGAGWSSDNLGPGDSFTGVCQIALNHRVKNPYCNKFSGYVNSGASDANASDLNSLIGFLFQYDGNTGGNNITDATASTQWSGWDTGSEGLTGETLRFMGDYNMSYSSGKIKIVGYSSAQVPVPPPAPSQDDFVVNVGTNANGDFRVWNSGLIEQWINIPQPNFPGGSSVYTLPVPFTSSVDHVLATVIRSGGVSGGNISAIWNQGASTLSALTMINDDSASGSPSSGLAIYARGF